MATAVAGPRQAHELAADLGIPESLLEPYGEGVEK